MGVGVNISPVATTSSAIGISAKVKDLKLTNTSDVMMVGVYTSGSPTDFVLPVTVKSGVKDGVLILNSYDTVNWSLSGAGLSDVELIIVSSYETSSLVFNAGDIPVMYAEPYLLEYFYDIHPNCSSAGDYLHCESRDQLPTAMADVKQLTGLDLDSVAFGYDRVSVSVPDVAVTPSLVKSLEAEMKEVQRKHEAAQKGIDDVF